MVLRQEVAVIFSEDPETRDLFGSIFSKLGITVDLQDGNYVAAANAASEWAIAPQYLVIDLADRQDPMGALKEVAKKVSEVDTEVVILADSGDISTYRMMKSVGVFEYFTRPHEMGEVESTLKAAISGRRDKDGMVDPEKVIAVHGVVGGAGTSAVASALARDLAGRGKRTMLIDTDIVTGSQSAFFGHDETPGLIDLIRDPSRVDGVFLERTVARPIENLSMLSAAFDPADPPEYRDDGLDALMRHLRKDIDFVVADVPVRAQVGVSIVETARTVLLVTEPSALGLRGVQHVIRSIPYNEARRVIVVVNKAGIYKSGAMKTSDFESNIDYPAVEVPFDPKVVPLGLYGGKSFIEEAGPVKTAIRQLTGQVMQIAGDENAGSKSWWARLFSDDD